MRGRRSGSSRRARTRRRSPPAPRRRLERAPEVAAPRRPPRRRCRRCRARGGGAAGRACPAGVRSVDLRAVHAVELHARGGDLRLRAARGRSSGSGSGRGGRGRPPRTRTAWPQLRQCLESAACCELGQRLGVVLDAEVDRRRARSRPRSATSGSSAFSTKRARPAVLRGDELGPAVGEQLQLAVAVELVAEQVGEQVERAGRRPRPTCGSHASSTSSSPSSPGSRPASSSAVATPQCHVRPGAGCGRRGSPARSRSAAIIAAVVVLPFVADTSTAPSLELGRHAARARRARAAAAAGPGAVVPPLRPRRRLAARSRRARALRDARASGFAAGTITRRQRPLDAHRRRGGADRVAVGVDGEGAVGARPRRPRRARGDACGESRCVPLKTLGQAAQEASACRCVGDHQDVEQAVVQLGVGEQRTCRRRRPSSCRRRPSSR